MLLCSKVDKNFQFGAQELLAELLWFSKIWDSVGHKIELLIKMCYVRKSKVTILTNGNVWRGSYDNVKHQSLAQCSKIKPHHLFSKNWEFPYMKGIYKICWSYAFDLKLGQNHFIDERNVSWKFYQKPINFWNFATLVVPFPRQNFKKYLLWFWWNVLMSKFHTLPSVKIVTFDFHIL